MDPKFRNMEECPDCGVRQRLRKEEGSTCDNSDCESRVVMYYGKLTWWNDK